MFDTQEDMRKQTNIQLRLVRFDANEKSLQLIMFPLI